MLSAARTCEAAASGMAPATPGLTAAIGVVCATAAWGSERAYDAICYLDYTETKWTEFVVYVPGIAASKAGRQYECA